MGSGVENMFVSGEITVQYRSPIDNSLLFEVKKPNTVVNYGLEKVMRMLIGEDTKPVKYIQIGSGGQTDDGMYKTIANDETSLYTFFAEEPVVKYVVKTSKGGLVRFKHKFTVPVGTQINEAGLFDDSYENDPGMFAKQTFIGMNDRIAMNNVTPATSDIAIDMVWDIRIWWGGESVGNANISVW